MGVLVIFIGGRNQSKDVMFKREVFGVFFVVFFGKKINEDKKEIVLKKIKNILHNYCFFILA